MMKEKILNEKGVTLISLSIAVIVILIITGTILYNLKDNLKIERLEKMKQDVENLRDKIDTYYAQYGAIPIKKDAEYTNISNMQSAGIISDAVDTGKFYVIDLQAIENLTLNFGQDYENVKTLSDSAAINEYDNLYIINETSHNIFYVHGIEIDGEVFYTNYNVEDIDTEPVNLINTDEIEDKWSPVYDVNGTYVDKNGDRAIVPAGFKVSRITGMDTIFEGLVIQDENGNEFVWVPVSKGNFETEFVREHFGTEEQKWWTGTFVSDEISKNNMYELVADGETVDEDESSSVQEVQKMYKSVKDNGGFYIGRYEAGNDGSGNVLCKKGVSVYNNIGWADTDDMADETGGAVQLAREFAEANNYETVKSTLVYGVQWDAVLRWISKDDKLRGYLTDSTGKGNYREDINTNSWKDSVTETGKISDYSIKNIYDMAGNVYEWTMEVSDTSDRVIRGGSYCNQGKQNSIADRSLYYPSGELDDLGFRIALYL